MLGTIMRYRASSFITFKHWFWLVDTIIKLLICLLLIHRFIKFILSIPPSISSLKSSSVPNLRMSSSSCLDMDPAFEPRPGRTTRWVSIIFLLATWVIRSSTEARVTKRYIITLLAWPIRWARLKAWEKNVIFKTTSTLSFLKYV